MKELGAEISSIACDDWRLSLYEPVRPGGLATAVFEDRDSRTLMPLSDGEATGVAGDLWITGGSINKPISGLAASDAGVIALLHAERWWVVLVKRLRASEDLILRVETTGDASPSLVKLPAIRSH